MSRGVLHDERLDLFADEADQALVEAHAHAADALGAQADRRREHQRRAVGFQQVDRADVGRNRRWISLTMLSVSRRGCRCAIPDG